MKNNNFIYIVEGETEKKLIASIKNEFIISGKCIVKNLLQNLLRETFLRTITPKTNIILVFDTDVINNKQLDMLFRNIKILKSSKNLSKLYLIPQVNNLEDELIYATDIKNIKDLTKSHTNKEFKSDIIKMKEEFVLERLKKQKFSIDRFWSRVPDNIYSKFENNGSSIKIKQ